VQAGRTLAEVARSLEISHKTLANWVRRARAHQPLIKREPVVAPDAGAVELSRLRAENARLRMDNDILKKAAAYFARESR
jgi:transposase